jgi:glutamate---cysteine ligase / carboxylate-amine ligase
VGIEEEVMLVDPQSWALTQRADELLSGLSGELAQACSAETHEGAIELKTTPHRTVGEAVAELRELRACLVRDAGRLGIAVATSGMHPAPMTEPTRVSPAHRAQLIDRTMRELARREPTFALHVHIGVSDAEAAIRLFNRLRAHLPMLLALSASSPFWRGHATGLASNRTVLFQAFPRTGLPRSFDGYSDWVETVDVLIRSGAIPEPTFLWWDIRPQPPLGTVEVRIMDAQPRVVETAALCALVQALARHELERDDAPPPLISQEVVNESRFLAARDGPAAQLIDPVGSVRVPVATLVRDALAAAAPHARALGAERELALVPGLVSSPEAARQLAVAEAGGLPALVEDLASRFADANGGLGMNGHSVPGRPRTPSAPAGVSCSPARSSTSIAQS